MISRPGVVKHSYETEGETGLEPATSSFGGSRSGHFLHQREEGSLACRVDAPVDRGTLVSVGIIALARIKIAPRSVGADRRHHVIHRPVEIEMVVFIEQDRHRPLALGLTG